MKKALIIIMAAAILLGFMACSQDEFASLLGRMGNNIYGIKADVRVSYKAASEVESSVSTNSDGDYEIDLDRAISLIDYVSEIKVSPSKVKALQARLDQPVSVEDADKVRAALSSEASAIETGTSELGKAMAEVKSSFIESLNDSVPTYGDVAILSLINQMNTSINAYDCNSLTEAELAEQGLIAVDVIKLVADIGSVDFLGDNLSDYLVSSKDVAKAEGNGSYTFGATMATIVDLITVNGQFNEPKYLDFIFQAKMLKAAYDMMIYPSGIDCSLADLLFMDPASYPQLSSELGFIAEDLGRYVVCTTFVAMDRLNSFLNPSWSMFLSVFIDDHYEALTNNGTIYFKDQESTVTTFLDNLGNDILEPLIGESYEYSGETLGDKFFSIGIGCLWLNSMDDDLSDLGEGVKRFGLDILDMLECAAVIVLDTNYESLITLLKNLLTNMNSEDGD